MWCYKQLEFQVWLSHDPLDIIQLQVITGARSKDKNASF